MQNQHHAPINLQVLSADRAFRVLFKRMFAHIRLAQPQVLLDLGLTEFIDEIETAIRRNHVIASPPFGFWAAAWRSINTNYSASHDRVRTGVGTIEFCGYVGEAVQMNG